MLLISVVIPTYRGAGRIGATLGSLVRQTLDADCYEVIVVVDGPDPATREAIAAFKAPFVLTALEQDHAGAAAARNLGAAAAGAPLVLFLDDDMTAGPQLLEAHLQGHSDGPSTVVIGCFGQARAGAAIDLLADGADAWWADHFAELAEPGHRFTYRDLCTGNVSLPKDCFLAVGGFSPEFRGCAGEDYELGIRLLKRGVRFRFAGDAVSVHRHAPSLRRMLQRAREEGRGNVLIAGMHPEVFPSLALRDAVDDGPWLRGRVSLRLTPLRVWLLPWLCRPLLRVAGALKLRRLWQAAEGALRACAYWRGACEQAGSWEALRALVQEPPLVAVAQREVGFDLARGLPALERVMGAGPLDAMWLTYAGIPVGRIAPVAGAETLRSAHVRRELLERFAYRYQLARSHSEREAPGSAALEGEQREIREPGA